jgi:hypothetical protein
MNAIKPPAQSEPPSPATPRISQSVPFVTETMAQLYLSQGHRSEAIDIYRRLIQARPEDRDLKARLAAIENEKAPAATSAAAANQPSTVQSRRFAGTGPSIRTVLRELFGFDGSASYASAATPAAGTVPAEAGSIDLLFSSEAVTDSLNPLAVAFDGGYVAAQGSVDDLFAGGR